jgi:hypothetical protein
MARIFECAAARASTFCQRALWPAGVTPAAQAAGSFARPGSRGSYRAPWSLVSIESVGPCRRLSRTAQFHWSSIPTNRRNLRVPTPLGTTRPALPPEVTPDLLSSPPPFLFRPTEPRSRFHPISGNAPATRLPIAAPAPSRRQRVAARICRPPEDRREGRQLCRKLRACSSESRGTRPKRLPGRRPGRQWGPHVVHRPPPPGARA